MIRSISKPVLNGELLLLSFQCSNEDEQEVFTGQQLVKLIDLYVANLEIRAT